MNRPLKSQTFTTTSVNSNVRFKLHNICLIRCHYVRLGNYRVMNSLPWHDRLHVGIWPIIACIGRKCQGPTSRNKSVNKQWRPKQCVWYWLSGCHSTTNLSSVSQFHFAAWPALTTFLFHFSVNFMVLHRRALCTPIGQCHGTHCGSCHTRWEKVIRKTC